MTLRNCAALLVATASIATANAAQALVVDVEGTGYNVTTFTGSYKDNVSRFTPAEMPWFGSATNAQVFARAIGIELSLPNFKGTTGPVFVYTDPWFDPLSFTMRVNAYLYDRLSKASPVSRALDLRDQSSYTYAVAAPQAVPSPLPLFGAAAGFSISRRLRRRIKLSA